MHKFHYKTVMQGFVWKKTYYRRLRVKSAYLQNWQFWLFHFFFENIPDGAAWKKYCFLWHKFKNAYAQDLENKKFESVIYEESKLRMSISVFNVDIGSEMWIIKIAYDV